jgi:hypothetical protein
LNLNGRFRPALHPSLVQIMLHFLRQLDVAEREQQRNIVDNLEDQGGGMAPVATLTGIRTRSGLL